MKVQSVSLNTQSGAVLFVSLIMLLVLTVIAVTGMQTTTLEEKMAGNLRDQTLAFQAAEAALRAGESWLRAEAAEPVPQASGCSSSGTVVYQLNDCKLLDSALWDNTSSPVYRTYAGTLQKVKTAPKYLIEYHSFIKDSLVAGQHGDESGRVTFRITARGTGGSDAARAYPQSTYTRQPYPSSRPRQSEHR
ncbi:MAG: pilus assembly PilX family protein [Gammaproteobacteria bacterium]